jgi:hypothetical protein
MKRYWLCISVLAIALLYAPMTIIAKNDPGPVAREDICISCGVGEDGCKSCVGGGSKTYCRTYNCGACSSEGNCHIGVIIESASEKSGIRSLKLSSNLIRDVGSKHPRFAATLAEMNAYGFFPGERQINWAPVRLTPADVEAFLNKGTHASFFKRYNKEARRLNRLIQRGELSDIVYTVSVKNSEDDAWSVEMMVEGQTAIAESGDPAYSALEIKIKPNKIATQGNMSESKKSLRDISWEIH